MAGSELRAGVASESDFALQLLASELVQEGGTLLQLFARSSPSSALRGRRTKHSALQMHVAGGLPWPCA